MRFGLRGHRSRPSGDHLPLVLNANIPIIICHLCREVWTLKMAEVNKAAHYLGFNRCSTLKLFLSQKPQLLQCIIAESAVGSRRVNSMGLSCFSVCLFTFPLIFHTANRKPLIRSWRGKSAGSPSANCDCFFLQTQLRFIIYVCFIIHRIRDVCQYTVVFIYFFIY